jgi:hypothetical protein
MQQIGTNKLLVIYISVVLFYDITPLDTTLTGATYTSTHHLQQLQ